MLLRTPVNAYSAEAPLAVPDSAVRALPARRLRSLTRPLTGSDPA